MFSAFRRRMRPLMLLAFVGACIMLVLAGCGISPQASTPADASSQGSQTTTSPFQGVPLGGIPAPAVTLADQNGKTVTLSQLRGHVVVLTFLDSQCTDQCPLTAADLMTAANQLGPAATAKVDWVALTVDPWHDTPASAQAFLKSHQVTLPIHWLLGTPAQMTPLWKAYHMAVLNTPGDVTHTVGVYVIDANLREQSFLDEGFDPSMLSHDIKVLLARKAS